MAHVRCACDAGMFRPPPGERSPVKSGPGARAATLDLGGRTEYTNLQMVGARLSTKPAPPHPLRPQPFHLCAASHVLCSLCLLRRAHLSRALLAPTVPLACTVPRVGLLGRQQGLHHRHAPRQRAQVDQGDRPGGGGGVEAPPARVRPGETIPASLMPHASPCFAMPPHVASRLLLSRFLHPQTPLRHLSSLLHPSSPPPLHHQAMLGGYQLPRVRDKLLRS